MDTKCHARGRPKAGEKSEERRFHAAAVRHRSIEQKQANGCSVSHRPGDGWCGHRGRCDGESGPRQGSLAWMFREGGVTAIIAIRPEGPRTAPQYQGRTVNGARLGGGWNRVGASNGTSHSRCSSVVPTDPSQTPNRIAGAGQDDPDVSFNDPQSRVSRAAKPPAIRRGGNSS